MGRISIFASQRHLVCTCHNICQSNHYPCDSLQNVKWKNHWNYCPNQQWGTICCIDLHLAMRMKWLLEKLWQPMYTQNADGTNNSGGMIHHQVKLHLRIDGKNTTQHFFVLNLGKWNNIILGYPWLTRNNPCINWTTGEVDSIHTWTSPGWFHVGSFQVPSSGSTVPKMVPQLSCTLPRLRSIGSIRKSSYFTFLTANLWLLLFSGFITYILQGTSPHIADDIRRVYLCPYIYTCLFSHRHLSRFHHLGLRLRWVFSYFVLYS